MSLELSAKEIEVTPALGLPSEAGIRGMVSLRNPLNHPAEFTWSPILGDREPHSPSDQPQVSNLSLLFLARLFLFVGLRYL